MRLFLSLVIALAALHGLADEADRGVLPVDASGRPLNLDFEDGTLKDWMATGDAFAGQPIKGDTVAPRRAGQKSRHAGNFWVGTYEIALNDKARGTLTSVAFKVTHPWGSFLVGGGADVEHERVEIVRAADKAVLFRATGREAEDMRRVAVDLSKEQGKEIFIRVVDDSSGPWGHINFDDFKFHQKEPAVQKVSQKPGAELLVADTVKFAGLKPEEAAKAITLPPGFKATLFAGEPDVVQPVAFAIDDRGRLWVAEANNYPKKAPAGKGEDRIIIFEDSTGSGHFDKRTVFIEGLNLVSGIEVGFGGVWVGQAPEMLFIPILEGDKPGKPQVLLDGFAYNDTHETLNSFNWGPDGWLYGCHGVFNPSKVGKPGTRDKDRIPMSAAVWRYHPTKKLFEIFAEGGSNQWGIDWNDQGQMFMTCCVIPHLYHVIQGGRYVRQAGPHTDPYTFADIKTIADHLHWQTGAANQWAANGKSDAFGGGHAHAGAMIYLGDNWPAQYRNQIFMNNIHGNRTNEDLLERSGSGYVGHHGSDFMLMNDKWSRLINLKYGPDGGVYAIDWYDKQACHLPKPEVWDRSNGRIYKITYGDVKTVKVDLGKLTDDELAESQFASNDWHVRHARRLLQERASNGPIKEVALLRLQNALRMTTNPKDQLRAMWALHSMNFLGNFKRPLARQADEYVRGWTVQLLTEEGRVPEDWLETLTVLAARDRSSVVRLYLASAMQRLPVEQRWDVIASLLSHGEDANDQNLPLLYWYAVEACVPTDVTRAAKLAMESKIPLVREFIARRLSLMADQPAAIAAAVSILSASDDKAKADALSGILEGFAGKRTMPMPEGWPAIYEKLEQSTDATVKQKSQALATIFGDRKALASLRSTLENPSIDPIQRQSALDSLLGAKDAETLPILQKLVADPKLSGGAIRGLAAYDDAKTPGILIDAYGSFDAASKLAALNTLASRMSSAQQLVAAVKASKIPQADLTAPTVRNLNSLNDKSINEWIAANWGSVRATAQEKVKEINRYRTMLKPEVIARGDANNGRAIFARTCMQCHTLFDMGAKIGPDLTGSNRADLSYLLENIVDPSAVIGKDYLMVNAKTKDGRFIDGIIKSQTDDSITFATVNEMITLPKNEIASQKTSNVSMMPEGLLAGLKDPEIRDLIKYLGSPGQVAMLADAQNVSLFFNGKDLSWWEGDPALWHVENGEIVGKTATGLKKNNFIFSQMILGDFRLVVQVKLTPNSANSGIQFRSIPWQGGEAKGYQADIGKGWWGKIYEESGRGLLTKEGGEKYLKPEEWNTYEVLAVGDHVRLAINGHVCSDITDPDGAKRGHTGLQLHSGGPTEVHYKDIQLELDPKDQMKTEK